MASTIVTPPASAPAAASATPAPASAPSTPAAPSAAPVTTVSTPAAPATPATPETPAAEPLSLEERLSEGWKAAKEKVEQDNAEPTETPAAAAAEPAAAPETPTGEEPKPGEPEAPETPAPAGEEFKLDLDDTGDVGDPAAFFAEVKKDPATEKFFADHPELKNAVAGALRRDKENREIRQYVPTVEDAKIISGAAATYSGFDAAFLRATTPEGAQSFLDHWVRETMFVDGEGKPIMENGQYKLHPSLPFLLNHITGNNLSYWGKEAKSSGKLPDAVRPLLDGLHEFAVGKQDERLQAAVNVLREAMSPSSPAPEEIPEALKPLADSLRADKAALQAEKDAAARRSREEQRVAHEQSIDRAEEAVAKSVKDQLKPRLANSGLSEFEQTSAMRRIGEEINAAFGQVGDDGKWTAGQHPSSRLFQSVYDSILRQHPPGEAREKALKRHILTYTNQVLGPILTKVTREAKKGTLDRQPEKQAKVAAQETASQTDPRGTSVTAPSPQSMTPAQLRQSVIEDYKKAHNNEEPDRDYVMREQARRLSLFGLK